MTIEKIKKTLRSEYPAIAELWHPVLNGVLTPSDVPPRSNKKIWWICPKGHGSYSATASHRSNGTGCPICAKDIMRAKASKPIDQLKMDGVFIKTFESAKVAREELNINHSGLKRYQKRYYVRRISLATSYRRISGA